MSKKFTEEQYQEIVEAWEGEYSYPNAMKSVIEKINGYAPLLPDFNTTNKAIALANPLTREWAHEQFVEEEKKYVWTLKTDNDSVINKSFGVWFLDKAPSCNIYFTEKEIENSPFKTEMFDNEDID